MMNFEDQSYWDLTDARNDAQVTLNRIDFEWHQVAPELRKMIVLIDQELSKRTK